MTLPEDTIFPVQGQPVTGHQIGLLGIILLKGIECLGKRVITSRIPMTLVIKNEIFQDLTGD
jgi:hypothetical protein